MSRSAQASIPNQQVALNLSDQVDEGEKVNPEEIDTDGKLAQGNASTLPGSSQSVAADAGSSSR